MNPYRTADAPKEPACTRCDGKRGRLEWTGMGSDWWDCARCAGTGIEPEPVVEEGSYLDHLIGAVDSEGEDHTPVSGGTASEGGKG